MITKYGTVTITLVDDWKPNILIENFHFSGVDFDAGKQEVLAWAKTVLGQHTREE